MAFDFYFAGTQSKESDELVRQLNGNVLRSYVNDRKSIQEWFERKRQGWAGKLMIDNGEFTFHRHGGSLNIDEYIQWLNDNDEYIDYAIALDKIPGVWGQVKTAEQVTAAAKQTWENYLYMYERVKSPKKLLPVFHQADNFKWLENILASDKPEYICISGNKELTNKQREAWYEECYYIISRMRPDIKVHCLGSATIQNAEKFPFASMDATSWIMTSANGSVLTEYGALYVGNATENKAHIWHNDVASEYVKQKCAEWGISFDTISEDYKQRSLYNIHYLFEKSRNTETKKLAYNKRRLF